MDIRSYFAPAAPAAAPPAPMTAAEKAAADKAAEEKAARNKAAQKAAAEMAAEQARANAKAAREAERREAADSAAAEAAAQAAKERSNLASRAERATARARLDPVEPAARCPPWTPEEEERLRRIVSEAEEDARQACGPIVWESVAEELGTGRTSRSVSQRWEKLTAPPVTVQGPKAAGKKRAHPTAPRPQRPAHFKDDDPLLPNEAQCFRCRRWTRYDERNGEQNMYRSCMECGAGDTRWTDVSWLLCSRCYRGCDDCEMSLCPRCKREKHKPCRSCGAACRLTGRDTDDIMCGAPSSRAPRCYSCFDA